MSDPRCGICGAGDGLEWYEFREMMFGTRDRFPYFQCGDCGCLQIAEVPADLSKYYPSGYYAHLGAGSEATGVRDLLRRRRNRYALARTGVVGRLLDALFPYPHRAIRRCLSREGLDRDSPILDVGCGSGELLRELDGAGYRQLLGVDPYVAAEVELPGGGRIVKGTLQEVEGEFDLIMFHHALEHVPDQLPTLRAAARLLSPGGTCLVRVPIVSSYAWEHYGEDWVQIDAPRHFYVHSIESLERVAAQAGLQLVEVEHDSTELQFFGSELYRRDVPLCEGDGAFTRREMREFRRRADALNREGRGDSAAFYFRRAPAA